jgi:hypothetical protein
MQSCPITLLGKGTKLIGATIKSELAREDLDQTTQWIPEQSSMCLRQKLVEAIPIKIGSGAPC